jgi:hypothetical protein
VVPGRVGARRRRRHGDGGGVLGGQHVVGQHGGLRRVAAVAPKFF